MISLPWYDGKQVHILAIYAPSGDMTANAEFWRELCKFWEPEHAQLPKPHILLGDMNMVESKLDRFPRRSDPQPDIDDLETLKRRLNLLDGWRQMNHSLVKFTFESRTNGQTPMNLSRIDRIYIYSRLMGRSCEWLISDVRGWTDHKLVSAVVEPDSTPYVGKGRSTVPPFVVDYAEMQNALLALVANLKRDLERLPRDNRSPTSNAQTLWKEFKNNIMQKSREFAWKRSSRIDDHIRQWESRRESILNSSLGENADDVAILLEEINDNIHELLRQKQERKRAGLSATHHSEKRS